MTQVTIRRVDESWVAKAKALAAERGVSMNSVLLEAIGKGLGVSGGRKTNGLERFAGVCPDEFGKDWDKAMEVFEQVDDELWR